MHFYSKFSSKCFWCPCYKLHVATYYNKTVNYSVALYSKVEHTLYLL